MEPSGGHGGERVIAGHRVVRLLAVGENADVLLARALDGEETVALKVYRDGTPAAIAAEAEALARAAGPHVVRLLDVGEGPDGAPVLVLERLGGGAIGGLSLGALLSRRARLGTGEAVTILAPVALALARCHGAGVAHGALDLESVLFDEWGAPVLTCFGRATLTPPDPTPAELEAVELAADRRALRRLASVVLAHVDDDAAARLRDELAAADGVDPRELERRIFALAPGEPVHGPQEAHDGIPRLVPLRAPLEAGRPDAGGREERHARPAALARRTAARLTTRLAERMGLAEWLGADAARGVVERIASALDPRREEEGREARAPESTLPVSVRLGSAPRESDARAVSGDLPRGDGSGAGRSHAGTARVRSPFRVLAVVAAVALAGVALVALLPRSPLEASMPGAARGGGTAVRSSASPASTAGARSAASADPQAPDAGGEHADGPTADGPTADSGDGGGAQQSPVDAFVALVRAREECRRQLPTGCLDDVDEAGSPALAADTRAIGSERAGDRDAWRPLPGTPPRLVQSLGGIALLAAEPSTSSALLVRTPGGWRIRDILSTDGTTAATGREADEGSDR